MDQQVTMQLPNLLNTAVKHATQYKVALNNLLYWQDETDYVNQEKNYHDHHDAPNKSNIKSEIKKINTFHTNKILL